MNCNLLSFLLVGKKGKGELDQVLVLGFSPLCDEVLSSTVAVYLKNRRLGSGSGKR